MSQQGMDIAAVEGYARMLEGAGATELSSVIAQVSGLIGQLMTVWKGPDADAYDQKWAEDSKSLSNLQLALGDLVEALNRAIAAQQWASETN